MQSVRWVLSRLFVLATTALPLGCNIVRPGGAYQPPDAFVLPELADGAIDAAGLRDAAVVEEEVVVPTFGVGVGGGEDAGTTTTGQDAGGTLSLEEQRLAALAGRYWVRLDMHSTATLTLPVGSASIKTLLSHFLITQLDLDPSTTPKTLLASEKLCIQTIAHECSQSCVLETLVRPETTAELRKVFARRRYSVDSAGFLTTEPSAMALGYAVESDESAGPLPEFRSDPRVWDLVPGAEREGYWTTTDVSVYLGSLPLRTVCDIFAAQRFVSAFSGPVSGWAAGAAELAGVRFALDTSGGGATVFGLEGLGCDPGDTDALAGAEAVTGDQLVRFFKVPDQNQALTEFWACPATEAPFAAVLPTEAP